MVNGKKGRVIFGITKRISHITTSLSSFMRNKIVKSAKQHTIRSKSSVDKLIVLPNRSEYRLKVGSRIAIKKINISFRGDQSKLFGGERLAFINWIRSSWNRSSSVRAIERSFAKSAAIFVKIVCHSYSLTVPLNYACVPAAVVCKAFRPNYWEQGPREWILRQPHSPERLLMPDNCNKQYPYIMPHAWYR